MNPAEFKLLRESLGLSTAQVGMLCPSPHTGLPVAARQVRKWESPSGTPGAYQAPQDAVERLLGINRQVEQMAEVVADLQRRPDAGPLPIFLDDSAFAAADPEGAAEWHFATVHRAMIARAQAKLGRPIPVHFHGDER